jgi:rhamnose utilization protein RhaD (predicted bifunctional aldolase and dehydrogenase)
VSHVDVDQDLIELSARLGADPMLVQGGGGNTSIKQNGQMWVKGSGTWLAEAGRRNIFVRVDLQPICDALARGAEPELVAATTEGGGLRPSIECSLHAVLPDTVVAHYHSVNAIAISVRHDAQSVLASLLDGLSWCWVPYRRPGTPLAHAVGQALASRPEALILACHGVVVGGKTCEEVWSRIRDIERRLEQHARRSPEPDVAFLEVISARGGYRPAAHRELHGIATDPVSVQLARRGSLYPDHVVFLGPAIHVLEASDATGDALSLLDSEAVPVIAIPGKGLLVRRSLTSGQREMVDCLARVLPRIPAGAEINYLTREDEAQLLNWQAEAYRKAMDT